MPLSLSQLYCSAENNLKTRRIKTMEVIDHIKSQRVGAFTFLNRWKHCNGHYFNDQLLLCNEDGLFNMMVKPTSVMGMSFPEDASERIAKMLKTGEQIVIWDKKTEAPYKLVSCLGSVARYIEGYSCVPIHDVRYLTGNIYRVEYKKYPGPEGEWPTTVKFCHVLHDRPPKFHKSYKDAAEVGIAEAKKHLLEMLRAKYGQNTLVNVGFSFEEVIRKEADQRQRAPYHHRDIGRNVYVDVRVEDAPSGFINFLDGITLKIIAISGYESTFKIRGKCMDSNCSETNCRECGYKYPMKSLNRCYNVDFMS
jgi:hypothetical protein